MYTLWHLETKILKNHLFEKWKLFEDMSSFKICRCFQQVLEVAAQAAQQSSFPNEDPVALERKVIALAAPVNILKILKCRYIGMTLITSLHYILYVLACIIFMWSFNACFLAIVWSQCFTAAVSSYVIPGLKFICLIIDSRYRHKLGWKSRLPSSYAFPFPSLTYQKLEGGLNLVA